MKRRIRHIILLALLANLGLVCFQTYWLRNTYLINRADFEKDAREALGEAIEQLRYNDARAIFLFSDSTEQHNHTFSNPQQVQVFNYKSQQGGNGEPIDMEALTHRLNRWPVDSSLQDSSLHSIKVSTIVQYDDPVPGQSNEKKIPVMAANDSTFMLEAKKLVEKVYLSIVADPIDLERVDSLYALELKKKLIDTPFGLDLYQEDSLLTAFRRGPAFNPAFTIEDQGAQIAFAQTLKVHFPPPTLFLLKKMGFSIAVSLCLISIMLASFWYMLNIIFKQKQLAEIKNDFINNMTHELKTPISILSTANEALLNFKALDDRQKTLRYLGVFQKQLDRLNSMVEKVLNISIYENDGFTLKKETVNLEEMIQDLIRLHQVPREKHVHIIFDNQLNHPSLKVDRIHFYNVLNNLFDNATKYSKEEIFINIKASETDKNILIEVKDRGIGIAKAHQRSIFEKFYRVPTGNVHNVKGFGLGLNYVKRIIEKHQGEIHLKSELSQGSTFLISLPKI